MLSEYFESPSRVHTLRCGPYGSWLEGFGSHLFQSGYSRITARQHIRSAEHLICWSGHRHISLLDIDGSALQRFRQHLSRCRCGRFSCFNHREILAGVELFLSHVQGIDHSGSRARRIVAKPELWNRFCEWMTAQRGTTNQGLCNYRRPILNLLRCVGEDPTQLDAFRLRQFVVDECRGVSRAAVKHCTTAVRMFVRFLAAKDLCSVELLGAVPTVACWRLASLPRYLMEQDVERLIGSCNRSVAVGKRDRAILLLLARLGLRAGDIVHLRLQDIDWQNGGIYVSGKNRREARLPLSKEVGRAIVSYLQNGRPKTASDAVFVRSRAPFRAFASHCAVSVLVDRAIKRAGILRPGRGAAHLLRHSLASSMLRHGASLQDISTLLRHGSIETTQIYAKVDVTALKQIAQPWPEAPVC
jgi:site-specific recombinase XerD